MEIHISLAPEKLGQLGPIIITNSMVMMFIVMALLLLVFGLIARNAKPVPGRAQGVFELMAEFLLSLVEGTGGKELGRRVFPLVGGIFIFVAFANYTGILPGVGTLYVNKPVAEAVPNEDDGEVEETIPAPLEDEGEASTGSGTVYEVASTDPAVPSMAPASAPAAVEEVGRTEKVYLMRPPNADLNMTLALATLTFTIVQVLGIQAHGAVGRVKHMANPPFLFPIEVVSEFSRIISLSARLFGNVFAGEVLLGSIYAMVTAIVASVSAITILLAVVPVIFILLEVLFGTIQALVFALLTLIYIAQAATHETHGHEAAHDEAHHPVAAPGGTTAPAGAAD